MWMIFGSVAAHNQFHEPVVKVKQHAWSELRPYARFPQGLPPGFVPTAPIATHIVKEPVVEIATPPPPPLPSRRLTEGGTHWGFAAGGGATHFTGTNDSPFVVMDRCGVPNMPKGLSVWAANAAKGNGYTISVSAAGAFQHDSNGLDRRNPRSTSTRNFRSRGAIPDAMVIRKDRVAWAIANNTDLGYVLHMFWVQTNGADGHVHPMVGQENRHTGWGAEGIRIRIKASVDLTKRGLSPGGLVVARTLQRYGAYLGDNSGSSTAIKAEQDHGQWGGLLARDSLKGLTWDDFEFVQRGYEP
jgi:hypothetical protein